PFWLSCWSGRNVGAVEVKGYKIEPEADLTRARLEGANLSGANLSWANLSWASPKRNIPGANLRGADLAGANLGETSLTGALADKHTIWPEGFNPAAAGVISK
ncbi:MAG: pentapeptide repeat-containing protein, partial [Actinobacteria bacterium]|nr:pentapeptide repeat-containing protein [Actinomycetota bacterium]